LRDLFYIHGFNSSPKSNKAVKCQNFFSKNYPSVKFHIPKLPDIPKKAVEALKEQLEKTNAPLLIGSSLGGFYANFLSEKLSCKAVLINPVICPHILMTNYLGEQRNIYTGETFTLKDEDMLELKSLYIDFMVNPKNRLVLLQTGDQTLDYTEARDYFRDSCVSIEIGGSHRFEGFDSWLPSIAKFLEL